MSAAPQRALRLPSDRDPAGSTTALRDVLASARHHVAARTLVSIVLAATAGALASLLLAVIADHSWPGGLPRSALRALPIATILALTAGVTTAVLWFRRRDLNPVFLAQALERAGGIRHNALVNAILLTRHPAAGYAADAALRQAARVLAEHPGLEMAAVRRRRWPDWAVLAALAGWLAYLAAASKPVFPSLARLAGADWPAPTATRIELLRPGPDDAPHIQEPLTFEFRVSGRLPREVHLATIDAEGRPLHEFTSAKPTDVGEQRHNFALAPFEVQGDIAFVCRAGDARLQGRIVVHPRPELVELNIDLTPPAYTGWPARATTQPDLEVLAATEATFSARLNVPVATPVLLFDSGRESRTRMTIAPDDPTIARATMRLLESGSYTLDLRDHFGFPTGGTHRAHKIVVRPDQPPEVQFLEPPIPASAILDARRLHRLAVEARDDVAVHALVLVLQQGTAQHTLALPDLSLPQPHVTAAIPLTSLPLHPGARIQAWFEATDGYVTPEDRPEPHVTRSPIVTLTWPAEPEAIPPAADADQPGEDTPLEGQSQPADSGTQVSDPSGSESPEAPPEPEAGAEDPRADGDTRSEPQGHDASTDSDPSSPGGSNAETSRTRPQRSATSETPRGQPDSSSRHNPSAPQPAVPADDGFEAEFERFIRQHGPDARDAGECLGACQGDSEGKNAGRGSSAGSNSPEPTGASEQRGAAAAPGGPSPPDTPEQGDSATGDSSPAEAEPAGSRAGDARGASPAGGASSSDQGAAPQDGVPGGSANPSRRGDPSQPGDGVTSAAGGQPGTSDPNGAEGEDSPATQPPSDMGEPPPAMNADPQKPFPRVEGDLESDGRAETVDLLEMLARGQDLTADDLVAAGWPPGRAADFVAALERLHEAAQNAGGVSHLRTALRWQVGDPDLQSGRGVSADLRRELAPAGAPETDVRRITPPLEESVPSELDPLLEAYYRALAQSRDD